MDSHYHNSHGRSAQPEDENLLHVETTAPLFALQVIYLVHERMVMKSARGEYNFINQK